MTVRAGDLPADTAQGTGGAGAAEGSGLQLPHRVVPGAPPPPPQGDAPKSDKKDDNVVDADFEIVDDKK